MMSRVDTYRAIRSHAKYLKKSAAPARILVVEDEPSVRDFVDRVLRGAGYSTALAADGPEALTVTEKGGTFDLLLTDLMMPTMRGDELARRMRHLEPSLKVLYLTGFTDQLFKEKITLWEEEAFLDKPCSVSGLLEAVAILLYGHLQPSA